MKIYNAQGLPKINAFAAPTALVGLAPVNGVSAFAMRSDAAPALDQAISPTWTGAHVFNAIPAFNGGVSGASAPFTVDSTFLVTNLNADLLDGVQGSDYARLSQANTFTGSGVVQSNTTPFFEWNETDGSLNNKRWLIDAATEQFRCRVVNDDGSASTNWCAVDRTGTTIDSIALTATAVTVNGQNVRDAALFTSGTLPVARGGTGTTTSTGTGSVVLSASPTLTGTMTAETVTIASQLLLTGVSSPAALGSGGTTNDWNPTGLATASVIRVDPSAGGHTITGLTGGVAGRVITMININNTGSIHIANEDAGSAAANRFIVSSSPITITQRTAKSFWYDGASSRWREFS